MQQTTFYWFDFETFGVDPARDRPCQFAGIRTDLSFNIIGEPLVLYCQPANDFLPQPDACLITGITPQKARLEGIPEAEFIARINDELSKPGTCTLGYNSIRFDDEIIRNTLYRNFFDPYAREWQKGNSRWDLLDIVRLTRALRPEGIEWPFNDEGNPSNRLEDLTRANQIAHESAHDALSDVYATIEIAKLIKQQQPKLFNYMFQMRGKKKVLELLNVKAMKPVVHVSGMFPMDRSHTAIVVPLALHPTNSNGVIVYDLTIDPGPLIELDVEQIKERIFTPSADLPENVARIPLKTVHINKCPVITPMGTLRREDAERININLDEVQLNLNALKNADSLEKKVRAVFESRDFAPITDPDLMLYAGGFFSDNDRQLMTQIRDTPVAELSSLQLPFTDQRLDEMLFRYRARNYPASLSAEEAEMWEEYRLARITDPDFGASITIDDYYARLEELSQAENNSPSIIKSLHEYADQLAN